MNGLFFQGYEASNQKQSGEEKCGSPNCVRPILMCQTNPAFVVGLDWADPG